MNTRPRLYPGDIVGVKGKGLLQKVARLLICPKTDRFHFFLIGDKLEDGDYVILESIGKGIAVGRLSFYNPEELEVYRLNDPEWKILGKKAAEALTWYGRAKYDYELIAKLLLSLPIMLIKHGLPPWTPEQIQWGRDNSFVCTEAASRGFYDIGHPVIPPDVIPMPASFKQAENNKVIIRIYPPQIVRS